MAHYDPARKLKEIFPAAFGQHTFSASDAIATMVHIRELLEIGGRKDQLSILNLYCNWVVHPEIDGSQVGYRVLSQATRAIATGSVEDSLNTYISESFSLEKLRVQLVDCFREYKIPTLVFESVAGWEMFGGQYFKAILHKRLKFPPNPFSDEKSAKIYAEMIKQTAGDTSRIVNSIRLRDDIPGSGNNVFWVVELGNGTEVVGPLKNLEKSTNFSVISYRR